MTAATLHFISQSEAETAAIAAALAAQCRREDCILLTGDLGAGKTTFARGFIHALCNPAEEVVSPTFTLVQTYHGNNIQLWHFDLYRLKSPRELQEIGLDEALATGISLIEWPELARDLLPASALTVHISSDAGTQRKITFSGKPEIWQSRFAAINTIVARA